MIVLYQRTNAEGIRIEITPYESDLEREGLVVAWSRDVGQVEVEELRFRDEKERL